MVITWSGIRATGPFVCPAIWLSCSKNWLPWGSASATCRGRSPSLCCRCSSWSLDREADEDCRRSPANCQSTEARWAWPWADHGLLKSDWQSNYKLFNHRQSAWTLCKAYIRAIPDGLWNGPLSSGEQIVSNPRMFLLSDLIKTCRWDNWVSWKFQARHSHSDCWVRPKFLDSAWLSTLKEKQTILQAWYTRYGTKHC